MSGRRIIRAEGLVVLRDSLTCTSIARNFAKQRLKALDGVTRRWNWKSASRTSLHFLNEKGRSLINYGTSASQVAARSLVFGAPLPAGDILPKSGPATDQPATPEQIAKAMKRTALRTGRWRPRHGMGIQYTPGATRLEVIEMFRLAAERKCRSTPISAAAGA